MLALELIRFPQTAFMFASSNLLDARKKPGHSWDKAEDEQTQMLHFSRSPSEHLPPLPAAVIRDSELPDPSEP